jgi:hypothetical protein
MGQDGQVKHFDHVVGSHAPLNTESQVLTGELINDVTDRKDTPLPVRVKLEINGPHLPKSASPDQALQARRGAGLAGCARSHAQPLRCTTSAGTYHAPYDNALTLGPRPGTFIAPPSIPWRYNRSSTGAQDHDHAAFSPGPPRGPGNTLTATAQQRTRARR